jgi:Tfp pilus assembly protein FimT
MKYFAKINWFGLWRNQGGFTLTEALISVALLSTGLMAYGTLSGSIMQRNTHSERDSIATTLAQDKIEEIKNMMVGNISLDYAHLYLNPTRFGSNWVPGTAEQLNAEGGTDGVLQFTREWQIGKPTNTQIASAGRDGGTGTVNIYDIRVRVSWNNNGPHNVELNTRVTE